MRTPYRPMAALAFACLLSSPVIAPAAWAADTVAFSTSVALGTIVVRTQERRLYLVLGNGRALRYVVGVGRAGRQWAGSSFIDGKYIRPNWTPPDLMVLPVSTANQPLPYLADKLTLDESKTKSAGEVSELDPGKSGTLTVNLQPGTYLLVCNQPGHYAAGMWAMFTVTK